MFVPPLSPDGSRTRPLCDRHAKRGVIVHNGDTDLDFRDLRSKSRAVRCSPRSLMQCIFVSTRLRWWYPLQFRQIARSRYFEARIASFLAAAHAVTVFHVFAFFWGGMTGFAPRSAMTSWRCGCHRHHLR